MMMTATCPKEERFQSNGLPQRLSCTRNIPLPVMSGALEFLCMRFGAWDTNCLRESQIERLVIKPPGWQLSLL